MALSNDIDSLLSCAILEKYNNWKTKFFYNFYGLYKEKGMKVIPNSAVGIDIDLINGRCLGNHIGDSNNNDCINLNKLCGITRDKYYSKFAMSTAITVLSILGINIDDFTEKQKEIILAIDCGFKSYYYNKLLAGHYIAKVLEYPSLIKILEKHDKSYFYNIIDKYRLYADIDVDDTGHLVTDVKLAELSKILNIDLDLPKQEFIKFKEFEVKTGIPESTENLFSLAWAYRNSAIYSSIAVY
ncbi:hypothetical protein ACSVC9_12040 [Clostridium sp. LBM24168]